MTTARLVLEDGSVWEGESFGAHGTTTGEVVFNTSITGYQEIASDPSYSFQIVVMTYPHIGNYGVDDNVDQSDRPHAAGFVVRDASMDFHQQSSGTFAEYLRKHGVVGISGIDTRAITRRLRAHGSLLGTITTESSRPVEETVEELRNTPSMAGLDLVQKVTALRPHVLAPNGPGEGRRIAVYDYGVKRDILRMLTRRGAEVVVYPASAHPEEILDRKFDGLVLSNGPGDPEPVTYAQSNIRHLVGRLPILGICLGHQILGLALGGHTYKLKFGHHGGNHPVRDVRTGRVEITAQNHGFAVDPDSLDTSAIELTHFNLNDGTLEGFRHRREPILAVQYHPEAAPGPHDSLHLFDEFFAMINAAS